MAAATSSPSVVPPPAVHLQLPMFNLPDWGDMGLSSILPPELLQVGEAQLREEERRRQGVEGPGAPGVRDAVRPLVDIDLGPSISAAELGLKPLPKLGLDPADAAALANAAAAGYLPAAAAAAEGGALSGSPPPIARRRKRAGKDYSAYGESDADQENIFPQLRSSPMLVMDRCYRDGCGHLGKHSSRSGFSDDDDALASPTSSYDGHRFRMEIADDGRRRGRQGFRGCCNQ